MTCHQCCNQVPDNMVYGLGHSSVTVIRWRSTILRSFHTILWQVTHHAQIITTVPCKIKWSCQSCSQEHGVPSWKTPQQVGWLQRSTPGMEKYFLTRQLITCTNDDRTLPAHYATFAPCCMQAYMHWTCAATKRYNIKIPPLTQW